jgi:hypothetical protein
MRKESFKSTLLTSKWLLSAHTVWIAHSTGNWSARVLINMHAALPISSLARSLARSRVYNKICNQLAGSGREEQRVMRHYGLRPLVIFIEICVCVPRASLPPPLLAVVYCNSCFFIPR